MKRPADIVVKPCGWIFDAKYLEWGYRIVSVPNKYARKDYFSRGDEYARCMFNSNQHGKFINGYKVEIIT